MIWCVCVMLMETRGNGTCREGQTFSAPRTGAHGEMAYRSMSEWMHAGRTGGDGKELPYHPSHRAGSSGAVFFFFLSFFFLSFPSGSGSGFFDAGATCGAPRLGRGRSASPREGVSTVSDVGDTGDGRGERE